MYKPLVSIIIPVYNGSNYLEESINSALAQTYRNIEVIVVNDGSTDGGATERIALSYGDRIRYFYKENGGVSTALNLGLEKMKGEWFSWLSHDDLYLPEKIESQIRAINCYHLDKHKTVLNSWSTLIDKNGKRIRRLRGKEHGIYSSEEMFQRLFSGNSLNGCALLIPKRKLQEIGGFDPALKYIQDWKCWVSLALEGCDLFTVTDELVMTRVHESQQTKKIRSLHPIEVDRFLLELLDKFREEPIRNQVHLQTVLFYTTKINSKNIRLDYKTTLKAAGVWTRPVKTKYLFYYITGKVLYYLKRVYRATINLRYRA